MATRSAAESAKHARPGNILIVIHEFVARSPDELSLSKGDRVELIERDDDFGDGWFLGMHLQNGLTGLFPEVYTITAPKQTIATNPNRLNLAPSQRPTALTSPNLQSTQPETSLHTSPAPSVQQVLHDASRAHGPVSTPQTTSSNILAGSPGPETVARPASSSSTSRNNAMSGRDSNQSSTVITETLSVIDEHITDMNNTNRGRSRSPLVRRDHADTNSEYSMGPSESRLSYIQGSETEEEEEEVLRHTEKEVAQWSPVRVAEYLEDSGVEKRHCEVFREQEFSGEVVLGMEQSTIFLKELDLGPIGRRLKTWQKIKALQDEVKHPPQAKSRGFTDGSHRLRKAAGSSAQPGRSEENVASGNSSLQHSPRPSAASVRSLGHSRRQSSIDQTLGPPSTGPGVISHGQSPSTVPGVISHGQSPSFDRSWNMSVSAARSAAHQRSTSHGQATSADRSPYERSSRHSQMSLATPSVEPTADKGYVSGSELDARRERRVLRKSQPSGHDRTSSYGSEKRRLSIFGKKSSSPTQSPEISGPVQSSVVHTSSGSRQMDSHRIVSEPTMEPQPEPSALPAAEMNTTKNSIFTRSRAHTSTSGSSRNGLRAISDAVTGREKTVHKLPYDNPSASTTSTTPISPDSSTPSGASKSFDYQDANQSQYSTPATLSQPAPKRKDKKKTSAYMLGLEKRSPQETMPGCDYSGWMKKKSSNLMTNWKPRLFVLRGRRLSYYYSDTDTEEKGLIDISGHRVLSADNERLTGLHASLTGATSSSPTTPQFLHSSTFAATNSDGGAADSAGVSPLTPGSATSPKEGPGFIFKLVPPRSGMSRAVNFTKPTVHYFAVPSIEEGRLWMAALMKATIDRDDSVDVVTTYQQKTISLAKAQARKERPPALKNLDEEEAQATEGQTEMASTADMETTNGTDEITLASNGQEEKLGEETDDAEEKRDQITEVTDLESPFLRSSLSGTSKHTRNKSSRDSRRNTTDGTGVGLGIEGLNNNNSKHHNSSPVMNRMHHAGLW